MVGWDFSSPSEAIATYFRAATDQRNFPDDDEKGGSREKNVCCRCSAGRAGVIHSIATPPRQRVGVRSVCFCEGS